MSRLLWKTTDVILATPPKDSGPHPAFIAVTYEFCKKILRITTFLAGIASISATPSVANSAEIIVTIPPLAAIVQMLDSQSRISCLLPAGSDPHHFQLSPRQIERLKQVTLLVRSSKDDHGWLKLSPETPHIDLWPEQDHAWLNPDHLQTILPRLAEKLIAASPERRNEILLNLKLAQKSVALIHDQLAQALEGMKTEGVMMQHPSWRVLFEKFGIPIIATLESQHHGYELGPRRLEEALNSLKQHPKATLIGSLQHSNRSLRWIADHTDEKPILYLDALGACGDDWFTLMQQNIARIQNR